MTDGLNLASPVLSTPTGHHYPETIGHGTTRKGREDLPKETRTTHPSKREIGSGVRSFLEGLSDLERLTMPGDRRAPPMTRMLASHPGGCLSLVVRL